MTAVWTPIALSRDLPVGMTRAVRLDGAELVAWRGTAGGPAHVWEDRCPHRGMRLSLGFVRNNALNCLYHGWEYGPSASCRRIPAHPDLVVPPTIKARAYVAAEAGGLVWVRRGEEDAPLPELPGLQPLASLAVDAPPPADPVIELALPSGGLHLRWHPVAPDRIMVHALVTAGTDPAAALARLRQWRSDREGDLAA